MKTVLLSGFFLSVLSGCITTVGTLHHECPRVERIQIENRFVWACVRKDGSKRKLSSREQRIGKLRELSADLETKNSSPEGGLTREEVEWVLEGNAEKFKECYQGVFTTYKPSGRVKVEFIIDKSGRVKASRTVPVSNPIGSDQVNACVVDVTKTFVFPEPRKGADTRVSYPISFSP